MILLHAVDSDLDKDTFNEYLYSVFSDSSSDSSSAPLNADDLPQHQLNICDRLCENLHSSHLIVIRETPV